MNKTTDIGDGIGVEWRRITYQGMENIRQVYEATVNRSKQQDKKTAAVADSLKAEQELIRLLCKVVTFTDDTGEVVRVDLTANPEQTELLPFNTMALLMRSKESPLVLSAKPSA